MRKKLTALVDDLENIRIIFDDSIFRPEIFEGLNYEEHCYNEGFCDALDYVLVDLEKILNEKAI